MFSETPGCCKTSKCTITVDRDAKPVNLLVRRVLFGLRDGVKTAIDKMAVDGVIEEADDSSS